jgi:hypothetical protein
MRDLAAHAELLRAASERLRAASRALRQRSGFLCRRSTVQAGRSSDLRTASLFHQHRLTQGRQTIPPSCLRLLP